MIIRNNTAFTLIEMIIVIVILGVIAVAVAPKASFDGYKEEADVTRFLTDIKYVQHKSMVTGDNWSIKLNTNSYELLDKDGNLAEIETGENPVNIKGTLSYSIDSGQNLIANRLFFDYLGRPLIDSNNLLMGKLHIRISGYNLIVEPYSGGIYKE
jgi:prepilin-type N-terminal cleavage/methylation domain-containing protein